MYSSKRTDNYNRTIALAQGYHEEMKDETGRSSTGGRLWRYIAGVMTNSLDVINTKREPLKIKRLIRLMMRSGNASMTLNRTDWSKSLGYVISLNMMTNARVVTTHFKYRCKSSRMLKLFGGFFVVSGRILSFPPDLKLVNLSLICTIHVFTDIGTFWNNIGGNVSVVGDIHVFTDTRDFCNDILLMCVFVDCWILTRCAFFFNYTVGPRYRALQQAFFDNSFLVSFYTGLRRCYFL